MVSPSSTTLWKGSHIFFHKELGESTSRLAISSGILSVDNLCESGQQYVPGAFVPKLPWRSPSPAEVETLTGYAGTGQSWDVGGDIAVVQIPEEYTSPFDAMLEDSGIRERCTLGQYTSISH